MNVAPIETWLAGHTGLVADKLGPGQVARVAAERMRATQCADAVAYAALLATSATEQLRFIEAIVVTETWFFRDRAALDGLARHVTGPWAVRRPASTFRLLSVPCSSGEEPYSIAMALALATWPAARLQIDAVDISRESLTRAGEGVYRKNSFRGADLAFREIFFEPLAGEAWRVRETVRGPVRFQEANLLAEDFGAGRALYDAVFCRNLLIYFDPPMQTRAFQMLTRVLADDGLLAVGPAEAVLALEHGFAPVPGESMFLFQKAAAKPVAPRFTSSRAKARPPRVASKLEPAMPATRVVAPARGQPEPTPPIPPLQKMRALADAGRLQEATELGASLLRSGGATEETCYLIALVADAAGDLRRAEEFYRKTLYLNPRHAEALAHLALLLERSGDRRGATALRARARRANELAAGGRDAKEVA